MRHQRPLNHTWETHSSCCLQALLHLSECQTDRLKPRGVQERARATTLLPLLCPLPCLWKQRDAAKVVKAVVLGECVILFSPLLLPSLSCVLMLFIFSYAQHIYTYICVCIYRCILSCFTATSTCFPALSTALLLAPPSFSPYLCPSPAYFSPNTHKHSQLYINFSQRNKNQSTWL